MATPVRVRHTQLEEVFGYLGLFWQRSSIKYLGSLGIRGVCYDAAAGRLLRHENLVLLAHKQKESVLLRLLGGRGLAVFLDK